MLKQTGIIDKNTKAFEIFNSQISDNFLEISNMNPSEYVCYCWSRYESYRDENKGMMSDNAWNSMNGNVFELVIASEMYRQGLCPMFLQAKVAFVPNVNFDILLYTSENFPIGISLKTSLRERYKQADLEATALKYVHRRARNYLITLGEGEARSAKNKVITGDVLGLDDVILADKEEFDALIASLRQMNFIKPDKIEIVSAATVVERI